LGCQELSYRETNRSQERGLTAAIDMTGAPSATHIPGSSPVVVNTAMQPLEPPHSVVAALLPGTKTWLLTGSEANRCEPAAVVALASATGPLHWCVDDAEDRPPVWFDAARIMVVAGVVPDFVVAIQPRQTRRSDFHQAR